MNTSSIVRQKNMEKMGWYFCLLLLFVFSENLVSDMEWYAEYLKSFPVSVCKFKFRMCIFEDTGLSIQEKRFLLYTFPVFFKL